MKVFAIGARRAIVALAVVSTLLLDGCTFDPSAIPVPGTSVSGDTYPVHIQFGNVLNLPRGAAVTANGVEIGNLTGVTLHDPAPGPRSGGKGYAVADVALQRSVRLPRTTKAELRQATPLGDVHIALTAPADPGLQDIEPGDVIPLSQTALAPQVEDTLAGLAGAVGNGAINQIQDTVRRLNRALPDNPSDTARTFEVVGQDLGDVADNLASVDTILTGLHATAGTVLDDKAIIDRLLSDSGVEHIAGVVRTLVQILFVFSALGPVAHSALWLAPLVNSLDGAAKAVVPVLFSGAPLDTQAPSNLTKLTDLIQHTIIPFAEHGPKVNMIEVTGAPAAGTPLSTQEQTDRIVQSLRMIGVIR